MSEGRLPESSLDLTPEKTALSTAKSKYLHIITRNLQNRLYINFPWHELSSYSKNHCILWELSREKNSSSNNLHRYETLLNSTNQPNFESCFKKQLNSKFFVISWSISVMGSNLSNSEMFSWRLLLFYSLLMIASFYYTLTVCSLSTCTI